MAAIFGTSVRPDTASPPPRYAAARPRRRRHLVALGGAGLAVAVAAGVLLGTSAVTPVTPDARSTRAVQSHVAAAPRPAVAPSLPPEVVPAVTPAPVLAARAPAVEPEPEPETMAAQPAAAVPRPRAYALAPRVPSTVRALPDTRRGAVKQVRRWDDGCLDDISCAGARLYDADGAVADAYAEATQQGVSARLLRDYRDEWLRARRVGRDRPREALRLYGMIGADLRTLAADADTELDRPRGWR
ncbi:hypothetical protein ACMGDM_05465 [Sphingomonas sp. DT-51]|uniref:hypothetical protein n=1 Tax=Sphingomonas sp. DT-51 TaxID=3396165 RepID=UPI003F1BF2E0